MRYVKLPEVLTRGTHVNGRFPSVYMSYKGQNFRLLPVSNLSDPNCPIFQLMYPGSLPRRPLAVRRGIVDVSPVPDVSGNQSVSDSWEDHRPCRQR